ncbi:MAG TPA: hypothetical protein VLA71_06500, partial [Algoriphagus sp.]|nr:hypothetical protein [Algoriphagus sp.]
MSTLTKQDTFSSLIAAAPKNFDSARKSAKDSFQAQGLPAVKAEEYKFTSISKKLEQSISNFSLALPFELTQEQVKAAIFEGFEGDLLVFFNGKFIPELSSKIDDLEVSLISEKPELSLGSIAKPEKDAFAALNQASFEDGIFISVPKKAQIEKPVLMLSFNQ